MKRNQEAQPDPGLNGLPKIRPHAGGIDVGSRQHYVCAPPQADGAPNVKVFGATTPEQMALAEWLRQHQVQSVAMESTGVYWIPLFELLESQGFEVILTDTRQLSHVPGRKSDMQDCQWIQLLHSCGLLSGCFRPEGEIAELRSLVRAKAGLVAEQADWLRRMQKSLDQMNVRVHQAVADINGTTGMAIVRAIVAGQRDPAQLALLRDPRCQKSERQIEEYLSGHWRPDHLFNLAQALKMYDHISERIAEYEREILRRAGEFPDRTGGSGLPPVRNPEKAKAFRRRRQEGLRQILYGLSGVDLTTIDGVGVETAEVVLSEYGPDLSRFGSEKQFVSHLRLAPRRDLSGGKPLRQRKGATASTRVGQALRRAAVALQHSRSALGAYYRRIRTTKGGAVAVFATARKIATLIFRLLRWGQAYVDEGAAAYEQRYQATRIRRLQTTAQQLGYQLVATNPPA
jgi:transposase